ncbi:MAG: iron chaperone [Candidatus Sericytochromatia bacterium]
MIDAYIQAFPEQTQAKLNQIRQLIRAEAPDATEKISYQMPTYDLNGNLVHFAGYEKHIGFYPGAKGISTFEAELQPYKHAKGSVQFPLSKPLPQALIKRIVKFRAAENRLKTAKK